MDMILNIIILLAFFMAGVFLIKLFSITGVLGKRLQFGIGHNRKYSKIVDARINEILENEIFIEKDSHYLFFSGDNKIWIENKYYGYGTLYDSNITSDGRCSWKTAKKLIKIEKNPGEIYPESFI